MDRPSAQRPFIFVSHSRADARWAELLKPRLEALPGGVVFWDDGRIDAAGHWYADLERLLEQTSVSLCLMSPDYLESEFGSREEFLHLLERRSYQGMAIVPLLLRPCDWRAAFGLTRTRAWPEDGGYVADAGPQWPERLALFVADPPGAGAGIDPPPPSADSPRVDLSRLPVTGWELFGRRRQLALLDDAWDTQINVVCLVASGGVGKSTVVNRWPEHLKADGYRGARRVYAWSFYSQGSVERMTSADAFMVEALAWFGDPHPDLGTPWDKGERLTELIRRERTLLILDGLEPLQSPQGGDRGRIKDPALATLVTGLGRRNPGLCVITSREPVADLEGFADAVRQVDLEQIPLAAGRALLRVNGIRGSDAELEDLARAFGRHALTLRLLAAYLNDAGQNRAAVAAELPDLDIAEAAGRHFRRVIAAFEHHLGEGPEVEALRLLGLFDRPADAMALAALRAPPAIFGLTEHLLALTPDQWSSLTDRLRQKRLIAWRSRRAPDAIDAHPLVREHFADELRRCYPEAWRAGNRRLFVHLESVPRAYPQSLDEMLPLYQAVVHGCRAELYRLALNQVFWRRIRREELGYSWKTLGAFGADLTALGEFFVRRWRQPVAELTDEDRAFVLNEAGFCLRALGRLTEAVEPMEAGLTAYMAQGNWENAARSAGNLSDLWLSRGDLHQALAYARQSVDLADRSRSIYQRLSRRATLGYALFHLGCMTEAEAAFREAETMQARHEPEFPLLYSLAGFRYAELLLAQGRHAEARRRLERIMQWQIPDEFPFVVALKHLGLGLACLEQARQEDGGDYTAAARHLEQAVADLRLAGQQDELPRGLLARARLRRLSGEMGWARADLDEAMTIARRAGLKLHLLSGHLEYARWCLAAGRRDDAREHWTAAWQMAEALGYRRRDDELRELAGQLRP